MKNGWLLTIFAVHVISYSLLRFGSEYALLSYDMASGFECLILACYALAKERKSYFMWSLVLFEAVSVTANCFKFNYAYLPNGEPNIWYIAMWFTLIGVCLICYALDNIWSIYK